MALKNCSILMLLILLASLQVSCKTAPVPAWGGKLFNGDSTSDGISRKNPNEPFQTIKCSTPAIDDYICMSGADFKQFVLTYVYGCKEWKSGAVMMHPELLWIMVKP